jgi:hypothetical protein
MLRKMSKNEEGYSFWQGAYGVPSEKVKNVQEIKEISVTKVLFQMNIVRLFYGFFAKNRATVDLQ